MAYQLYSTFWGLNLGVIKSKELRADLNQLGFRKDEFVNSEKIAKKTGGTIFSKMG